MSALEQELIDRIRKLDENRKRQVLMYIEGIDTPQLTLGEWLQEVEAFQKELEAKYGKNHFFGTLELLDELREEASWPRY